MKKPIFLFMVFVFIMLWSCYAFAAIPVADAGADQSTVISKTVTLDGSSSSDVDGDPLSYSWSFIELPANSNTRISDQSAVNPTFYVDVYGEYVVQLIVKDAFSASLPDKVTIDTTNSKPVADAGPDQSVYLMDLVTLDGSNSSDIDGDPLLYDWSLISIPPGSKALLSESDTINPRFTVDVYGKYIAMLITNDGIENSDPMAVVITTANSRPVANPGSDQGFYLLNTVTLDGSSSTDIDGDLLNFDWSLISIPDGSDAQLDDPGSVKPVFFMDVKGTYIAQLIVNDGLIDSYPATVAITTENSAPVANAGDDQTVFLWDKVMLDGSSSTDVDGDLLSFKWSLISSPHDSNAILDEEEAVMTRLEVDAHGTYLIQLIVNDGFVDSDPVTVVITTKNTKPVADAGSDQSTFLWDTVILDGSLSKDNDQDLLTYTWSFTSIPLDSGAILSDQKALRPSFEVDAHGIYVVQLIVNDGFVDSNPVTTIVTTENSRPVANAGNDITACIGDDIILDGTRSRDPDGDLLSYNWFFSSMPTGSRVEFSNTYIARPGFRIDSHGTYVAQLIVNDNIEDSPPDTVLITVLNNTPVAIAGNDQNVSLGDRVLLNGNRSMDKDNDSLSYSWRLIFAPTGSRAIINNPKTIRPYFIADTQGKYEIELIVEDGIEKSKPDKISITVVQAIGSSIAPIADAGSDRTISVMESVRLNGSNSYDSNKKQLSYQWSLISNAYGNMELLDTNTSRPEFKTDTPGKYIFQLIVNNGTQNSIPSEVVFNVTSLQEKNPLAPVADAGADQIVFVKDLVRLDGSGSKNTSGDPLNYIWSFKSRPSGSKAKISNPSVVNPSFEVDMPGTYIVQLVINNGLIDSDIVEVIISTQNSPPKADAGPDKTYTMVNSVQIDGNGSKDADGDPLYFIWSLLSFPPGSNPFLAECESIHPTLYVDLPGNYIVQLSVADANGGSDSDSVLITIVDKMAKGLKDQGRVYPHEATANTLYKKASIVKNKAGETKYSTVNKYGYNQNKLYSIQGYINPVLGIILVFLLLMVIFWMLRY